MAADGEQVDPQPLRREGHLAEGLHRVGVEEDIGRVVPDQPGALGHGLEAAQLIVHQHHGHQYRVLPQGGAQVLRMDMAPPVGLEAGHRPALGLQGLEGFQHGGVLDGGGDDMPAPVAAICVGGLNGPVVPLGAAGGEKNLLRPAAQGPGHPGPVVPEPLGGLLPEGAAGGGVAETGGHLLQSGLGGLRPDPGGGGVVQISEHSGALPRFFLHRHDNNILSFSLWKVKNDENSARA